VSKQPIQTPIKYHIFIMVQPAKIHPKMRGQPVTPIMGSKAVSLASPERLEPRAPCI
jgi:hypothetical protein